MELLKFVRKYPAFTFWRYNFINTCSALSLLDSKRHSTLSKIVFSRIYPACEVSLLIITRIHVPCSHNGCVILWFTLYAMVDAKSGIKCCVLRKALCLSILLWMLTNHCLAATSRFVGFRLFKYEKHM